MDSAEEAKSKGNKAFSQKDYTSAITHFIHAITLSPTNHVLYSNRSASFASINDFKSALSDAEKTVSLKPDWGKGYSRLGAAHLGLRNYVEAESVYKKGLEIEPDNEGLKAGLEDVKRGLRARGAGNLFGDAFSGPEMWAKLTGDPKTRGVLQQDDYVKMMQDVQKNPSNLNKYLQDQRVMQSLGVLLNINLQTAGGGNGDFPMPDSSLKEEMQKTKEKGKEEVKSKKPEPEPEPMEEEEVGEEERKKTALMAKEVGNAAYKRKEFERAVECYSKAYELDDEDISYLTNRAAVYLKMGKAVERGRELRSDFKMIARALTRKGTALAKMAKTSKDYEPAIEAYQKALTEHRNPDTLKKLKEAEKAKKDLEQLEYFDPNIADEEREKGNQCFKEQKYPEAVKHYSEAIKRNPKDPKAYSNRAACYTKLAAMPEALKDVEKCIELDPTFVKGYTRKGAVQFFMKKYDKALETYQEGLKLEANNQELLDGVRRCVAQINKASRGDLTPEELKERQAKGMQDPEVQNMLTDPVMRQVLVDLQENPKSAQEHMKNPMVMNKIQKLVNAGIVLVR